MIFNSAFSSATGAAGAGAGATGAAGAGTGAGGSSGSLARGVVTATSPVKGFLNSLFGVMTSRELGL
jgi:hypothetical protein